MEAKEKRGEKREGRYRQNKTSSASGGDPSAVTTLHIQRDILFRDRGR